MESKFQIHRPRKIQALNGLDLGGNLERCKDKRSLTLIG